METVGGAGTIRGFSEERFRDTRNLLMSAEYRWEAWTHLDLAIFVDAGKVFSRADEFNFSGLHTGYGFGARFHTPGGFVLRFDLARSPEGTKLHIGAGPSF
jgi:outer membrane translocation and assembly module TamA